MLLNDIKKEEKNLPFLNSFFHKLAFLIPGPRYFKKIADPQHVEIAEI